MPITIQANELKQEHVRQYLRFDNGGNLSKPAKKRFCYLLHSVWADGGISVKKHGTPSLIRPMFLPSNKLRQTVEVLTRDEFDKLPE